MLIGEIKLIAHISISSEKRALNFGLVLFAREKLTCTRRPALTRSVEDVVSPFFAGFHAAAASFEAESLVSIFPYVLMLLLFSLQLILPAAFRCAFLVDSLLDTLHLPAIGRASPALNFCAEAWIVYPVAPHLFALEHRDSLARIAVGTLEATPLALSVLGTFLRVSVPIRLRNLRVEFPLETELLDILLLLRVLLLFFLLIGKLHLGHELLLDTLVSFFVPYFRLATDASTRTDRMGSLLEAAVLPAVEFESLAVTANSHAPFGHVIPFAVKFLAVCLCSDPLALGAWHILGFL